MQASNHENSHWWSGLKKAWQRSLSLVKPQQAIPFLFITMKGWIYLLRNLWYVLLCLSLYGSASHFLESVSYLTFILVPLVGIASSIALLILVGYARPSVDHKGATYVTWLFKHNYGVVLSAAVLVTLVAYISFRASLRVPLLALWWKIKCILLLGIIGDIYALPWGWLYTSPLLILYILCYIDKVRTPLRAALKLVVYDYPVLSILGAFTLGMNYLVRLSENYFFIIRFFSYSFLYMVFVPFVIMALVNLYSKRVHDNYEDYF